VSVLLIGVDAELGAALIPRLIAQDDEVRVIEADENTAARWRSLGAHVAAGETTDSDLIERAAQGVRTLVLFEGAAAAVEPVVEGASLARVDRLVLCSSGPQDDAMASIRASRIDYVVLRTGVGRRRLWGGRNQALSHEVVAEAIDAADDLAGKPKLDLDLRQPASWRQLGLVAPP
jgi:uncharacterized protein YbjT (DUF2867 family)